MIQPGDRVRIPSSRVAHIVSPNRDDRIPTAPITWCERMTLYATPAPTLPLCARCARHTKETQ